MRAFHINKTNTAPENAPPNYEVRIAISGPYSHSEDGTISFCGSYNSQSELDSKIEKLIMDLKSLKYPHK